MRESKPPALATWLVEHLVSGDKNEALTGDLMEQFRQGRSVAWYWRQVFGAILVGCTKQSRILWISIGATVVWTLGVSKYYGRSWVFAEAHDMTIWGIRHGWTLSPTFTIAGFIAFNALPVVLAVSMYLGLMRMFSFGRFLRGLSAGLLTMALCVFLFILHRPKWLWHHQNFIGYLVAALPVFLGLVVSMWTAKRNSAERRDRRSVLA